VGAFGLEGTIDVESIDEDTDEIRVQGSDLGRSWAPRATPSLRCRNSPAPSCTGGCGVRLLDASVSMSGAIASAAVRPSSASPSPSPKIRASGVQKALDAHERS